MRLRIELLCLAEWLEREPADARIHDVPHRAANAGRSLDLRRLRLAPSRNFLGLGPCGRFQRDFPPERTHSGNAWTPVMN